MDYGKAKLFMEVESIAALIFDILWCTNVTKISMLESLHLVSIQIINRVLECGSIISKET
jgi:hypothetical protein